MNEQEKNRLVDAYLNRLRRALAGIPQDAQCELLDDLRDHIEEAWAASETRDRTALEAILARLGTPEDLAREERARLGPPEPVRPRPDALAVAAVVIMALFWPLGILLAWLSARWRTRTKAIATAIPIAGLALVLAVNVPAAATYLNSNSAQQVTVWKESAPAATQGQTAQPVPGLGWGEAIALALSFFGWSGAPLVAAIYLGLQLRPRAVGDRALIPVVAATLLISVVFAVSLLPAASRMGRATVEVSQTETVH